MPRECLIAPMAGLMLAAMVVAATPSLAAERTIATDALTALVTRFQSAQPVDFPSFAEKVRETAKHQGLERSIGRYINKKTLDHIDRINIYRLLGIYGRIKYKSEMIRVLTELVALPTFKREGMPQHLNPHIIKLGETLEKLARAFELEFRNTGDRIFEIILAGTAKGAIGAFTHGDVVPVENANWRVKHQRRFDPFQLKILGDRMYGRGASDNKASIVAALFALKIIKESGFSIGRTIRLFVETTEETGGSGIEYYKQRHGLPGYNIVLDGRYPVGVAEKGFGVVMAKFPVREAEGIGGEIVEVTGGGAINQVPYQARATIIAASPRSLNRQLSPEVAAYVKAKGGNFRILLSTDRRRLIVTVIGEGTHSARPDRGVNPVSRLFDFLNTIRDRAPLKRNHFTDAAAYVADNWGIDDYGKKLGIDYADDFMGRLTAVLTTVKVEKGVLHVAVNPRAPRGKEPEQLIGEISEKLAAWRDRRGIPLTFDINIKRYMYRDPKGLWIKTLLDTFTALTGLAPKPRSSNGYTSARQLPNGIQFGPGMPGERGTAHKKNEFKTLSNFLRDVQILTETFLRLGNLKHME